MQQVKAVVALAKGVPVQLTTINVPDPGPGEAVVKIQACGVCHTDLHYRDQRRLPVPAGPRGRGSGRVGRPRRDVGVAR
jgi:Zn-dependent alcohol dehydrogenase